MNEKFNKNTKVEQLTNMFLNCGEEKGLTVKDPYGCLWLPYHLYVIVIAYIWQIFVSTCSQVAICFTFASIVPNINIG